MHFLFITTTNVATNPRLFKEIRLCQELGFCSTVIQFNIGGWSELETERLKKMLFDTAFIEISAKRKPFLKWILSSLIEFCLNLIPIKFLGVKYLSYSINKRSYLINRELNKNNVQFDWVIAHNPGAFFSAWEYSIRNNCKLGLDIEDYHPGEYNDAFFSERMLKMMEHLLPQADYCSFASPLIQTEIEKHIPNHSSNWFTVVNGFPKSEFKMPNRTKSAKIKMIWFSQNISPGRGLENFISLMGEFEDDIELHIVGDLAEKNRKLLFNDGHKCIIHPPMNQVDLHQFLSTFTVGLVTDPPINRNRELAITNKIIAYSQAGLYILSISADGHNEFLNESELNYRIIENDKREIRQALLYLISNYSAIVDNQYKKYEYAQINAWESINGKLIETWQN